MFNSYIHGVGTVRDPKFALRDRDYEIHNLGQQMDGSEDGNGYNDENSNNINLSTKNPGLKIISKQVMRAVQDHEFTTYKEVANVVS